MLLQNIVILFSALPNRSITLGMLLLYFATLWYFLFHPMVQDEHLSILVMLTVPILCFMMIPMIYANYRTKKVASPPSNDDCWKCKDQLPLSMHLLGLLTGLGRVFTTVMDVGVGVSMVGGALLSPLFTLIVIVQYYCYRQKAVDHENEL